MNSGLTTFEDCAQLPFNRMALDGDFVLKTPSQDPGGEGVWLILQGQKLLVAPGTVNQLPHGELPPALEDTQPAIYIGQWQHQPCRLLALDRGVEIPPPWSAIHILDPNPDLSVGLLSLAGLGNAILHWERTSCHCDNCGGTMAPIAKEWGKRCTACGAIHYPRIHPCIIVAVTRGKQLLLVRKAEWIAGRFGLVAGFVEFAENLEQTVERELFEETGIRVKNIRYQGSQSWPFPSQLMAGYTAEYCTGELKLQEDELDDGGWFSHDNLPQLPPARSIARWLIDKTLKDLQKPPS